MPLALSSLASARDSRRLGCDAWVPASVPSSPGWWARRCLNITRLATHAWRGGLCSPHARVASSFALRLVCPPRLAKSLYAQRSAVLDGNQLVQLSRSIMNYRSSNAVGNSNAFALGVWPVDDQKSGRHPVAMPTIHGFHELRNHTTRAQLARALRIAWTVLGPH